MRIKRIVMLGITLIAALGFFSVPLTTSCAAPEVTMARNYQIPPIDAARPAVTETATFAMG
jgi:hypothetical protein